MVFNAIFNNFTVISWRSVLLVEETGAVENGHSTHFGDIMKNKTTTTLSEQIPK